MKNKQVKSKSRVSDYGEVYTAEREVNAMLDLVKEETERIESRFLEPACGNGNFLAEILRRKLRAADKGDPEGWERRAVTAVMSIYGIDILPDNARECRERLYGIWSTAASGKGCCDESRAAVRYVLARNIVCGNALTAKTHDGAPIVFSEWTMAECGMVRRRDFRLDALMQDDGESRQTGMFDDEADGLPDVTEYAPVHYRRIADMR